LALLGLTLNILTLLGLMSVIDILAIDALIVFENLVRLIATAIDA
jgi:multidrug efflux pump subunit AcrB